MYDMHMILILGPWAREQTGKSTKVQVKNSHYQIVATQLIENIFITERNRTLYTICYRNVFFLTQVPVRRPYIDRHHNPVVQTLIIARVMAHHE